MLCRARCEARERASSDCEGIVGSTGVSVKLANPVGLKKACVAMAQKLAITHHRARSNGSRPSSSLCPILA
jgi:hypothetical protein